MSRFLILFALLSYNTLGQGMEDNLIDIYRDSIQNSEPINGIWYEKLANLYMGNNKYDSAKKYYRIALQTKHIRENPLRNAYILNNLGVIYYSTDQLDSSITFYSAAKEYYIRNNKSKEAAFCLSNLGIIYKDLGHFEKALENLLEAARILEPLEQGLALASCYTTIGNIFSRQNDLKIALFYNKEALRLRKILNHKKLMSSSYNNIGLIFHKLVIYDSSVFYYKKSLEIKEILNDIKGAGATFNNIGIVLIDQKNFKEASTYLLRALHIKTKTNDITGMAITYNNLGLLHLHTGEYQKALTYLDKAAIYIKNLSLLPELKDNLETKILVYEQLGQSQEAFILSKQLLAVKDSLLNQEKIQSLIAMEAKYDLDKKVKAISILENTQQLQQAQLQLNEMWLRFLIIFIIMLAVIVALIVNLWRKERSGNMKVQTLMQELHHRVKNNLQLLSSLFSLQSRLITDKSALEAVKIGENRVNAMAIIHQKLYVTKGSRCIDLKEYLSDLIGELAESYGYNSEDQNIKIKIDQCDIDVDKVIPVGLIVNELVSNSFKYAFPSVENPSLFVEVVKNGHSLTLNVEDNGIGFVQNQKSESSMGLNIIETLSRQLKAKINWKTQGEVKFNLQLALN